MFGDKRLYMFYARPAYRTKKKGPLYNLNFAPVGFLLDTSSLSNVHPVNVIALDSGALDGERLSEIVHSDLSAADFALDPSIKSAQQIATLFYGSGRNYFNGARTHAQSIPVNPTHAEVVAYSDLVARGSNREFDERATSIELHFKDTIPILGNVLAIILPQEFLDVAEIKDALKAAGVKPLPYAFMPDHTSKEVAGRFYEIASRFYSLKCIRRDRDW